MKFLSLLAILLSIVSCSKNTLADNYESILISHLTIDSLKIANNSFVSTQDAINVAKLYGIYSSKTKSGFLNRGDIINVYPILGDNGETLMYGVCFAQNNGYILVSAKKDYIPIIADVEIGTLDLSDSIGGLSLLMSEYKQDLSNLDTIPNDIKAKYRKLWNIYEKNGISPQNTLQTKSGELSSLVNNSIQYWISQGYEVYCLEDTPPDGLPENVYQDFITMASAYTNPNYDYMPNSFILVDRETFGNSIEAMVLTSWKQDGGYNAYTPQVGESHTLVGCAAVALRQIMKKWEYPSNIPWSYMQNNIATDSTAKFLWQLAESLNTNYGLQASSVSETSLLNTIEEYNYNFDYHNHSIGSVRSSLNNRSPVLMTGLIPGSNFGHAWVCDGYINQTTNETFTLMVISMVEPPLQYEMVSEYGPVQVSQYNMLHMNWGWDDNNGWFSPSYSSGFSYSRKDILNIRPNI